jgi:hypothetical protein
VIDFINKLHGLTVLVVMPSIARDLRFLLRPDRRAYGGKLGAQRQQRKIRWVNQIVKDQLQR